MAFVKATKQQAKLRMAIHGPAGAGKTKSSLKVAHYLIPGGRIALIDTESGSASKYAGCKLEDGGVVEFDVDEITNDYHPDRLLSKLREAEEAGYDVAIVDSLSHFWNGQGGLLELVDAEARKGNRGDSHAAWKAVDPIYRRMVQGIMNCKMHLLLTMRAKQEYARVEENGRTKVKKLGLAPEMRDSFNYTADIEGMMDVEHYLAIGKTRCDALDGKVFHKPGRELAEVLRAWLTDGAPETEREAPDSNPDPRPQATAEESARTEASLADAKKTSDTLHALIFNAKNEPQFKEAYRQFQAARISQTQRRQLRAFWEERKEAWKAAQPPPPPPPPDPADDELPEWAGGKAPPEDEERAAIQGA